MSREPDNGFEDWGGYMQAKITKLEEQYAQSSDFLRQSNLFAGISIFVNGLTNPSADELKRIMMVHGGVFHHYQRSHTTHIIASNLPDVKIRNMNTSNIIKPDWVVDCLKANKILDYTKYLLYTNQKPSQPRLHFKKLDKEKPISQHGVVHDKNSDAEISNIMKDLEELNSKIRDEPQPPLDMLSENDSKPETLVQGQSAPQVNAPTKFAKSAVDPNFLSEFYNNSRLHHIATLGAGFKQYVSELREKHIGSFPQRQQIYKTLAKNDPIESYRETIMHIDMDCFFVSVGLRSRPHLAGLPIAVTHSKGADPIPRQGTDRQKERELYVKKFEQKHNSIKTEKVRSGFEGRESLAEIASCSYEARKMGVRNGMFVGQALKLCPNLKTIPYDFEEYKEVAFTLYNTIAQYTLDIEAVSCDEMFVDLGGLLNDLQLKTMEFVEYVRSEVKTKTGCPCSAGVGGNRLQARMATKKAKPDGQFFLNPENVEEYMANIPIEDLPGVGYSTSYTLEQLNLKTCGDLQRISMSKLQQEIGKKFGETLYRFCRGLDNRPLVYGQVRKSISAEVNYGIRFTEFQELDKFLRQLCTEVHSRLMAIKRRGKCVTLKLMVRAKEAPIETSKFMGHGYCDNLTKSSTLSDYTCDLNVITKTILNTMKSLNIPPQELRGIGIHISKLDNPDDGNKMKKDNVLKAMFEKAVEKQKTTVETSEKLTSITRSSKTSPIKTKSEKRKASSPMKPDKKPSKTKHDRVAKSKRIKTVNVSEMLQNSVKGDAKDLPADEIDYDVLAELPDDIKEEVLREHRFHVKQHQQYKRAIASPCKSEESPSKVAAEFLDALPPELRTEIEKDIVLQQNRIGNIMDTVKQSHVKDTIVVIESNNIFDQSNCRQLIEAWVESSDDPEEYDVDIFAQNAQQLVQMRRISDLYVPLKMLRRITSDKKCSWHAAYRTIISVVQKEMIVSYGSRLMLDEKTDCDRC